MTAPRLSAATLARLPVSDSLALPPARAADRRVGILHLGIGAFHRAHQAVFTEDAAGSEPDWGICGVSQRSTAVLEQLQPQDCLYTVLQKGRDATTARVVGQLSEVLFAAEWPRLVRRFADPAIRILTLTVTEKGYRRASSGGLDLTDPLIRDDLAGTAKTVVGQLVRGLQQRMLTGGAPISVLCCDNLIGNGRVVRRLVAEFTAALPAAEGDRLTAWIDDSVAFPNSMVDRIVPATTDGDRAEAQQLLGVRDQAMVVAEPFLQWVIEDRFAADRPAWERAGADLVDDVGPFETVKLRMLNGTHTMLAYLGALRGYDTIAQALDDDELATAAGRLISQDVTPTLLPPPGLDVDAYGRQVLQRFANPALRHRTLQVAMDGSQKIPQRLLGTIRDRLAIGATPTWAILAVAGWIVFLAAGTDRNGRPLPLQDPLAPVLRRAVGHSRDPAAIVDRLLTVAEVFGADLRDSSVLRRELTDRVSEEMTAVGADRHPAQPGGARP